MKTKSRLKNKAAQVKNEANEIYIQGDIVPAGWDWYESDVTLKKVREQMAAVTGNEVKVHVNSCGGDVFEGIAIYRLLKDSGKKITIIVDAIAASIASVIAMAGDVVIMNEGAQLMIHNPSTYAHGDVAAFEKVINSLNSCKDSIVEVYNTRAADGAPDFGAAMDAETWLTGEKAKAYFNNVQTNEETPAADIVTNRYTNISNHFKKSIV